MTNIQATAKRWGNSLAVIIPNHIAETEKIKENDKLNIIILPDSKNVLRETFGSLKGKIKKSSQQIKDELRRESSTMSENIDDVKNLFFDTYAFLEILKGNQNYKKYTEAGIITTKLNLFELYLKILREESEENAEKIFDKYYPFIKDLDQEVIKEAAKLKIRLNKREVSMTDCIGYTLAKQLDVKFLTGDHAFEKMDNVEFIK